MEILREPRVTLIARPQFIEPAHLPVAWKGESTDGERIAEFAGRLCYMSQHNPAGPDHRRVPQEHSAPGPRLGLRALPVRHADRGHLPLVQPRAGAPPGGLGLVAALPAVRGRVARRVRHAAGGDRRPAARGGVDRPGGRGAGGLRDRGRAADGALRRGRPTRSTAGRWRARRRGACCPTRRR